jgi:hypothetical protein
MNKRSKNSRDDLIFDTESRWKRIRLTIIELACVLVGLFVFCYALHLVEAIG